MSDDEHEAMVAARKLGGVSAARGLVASLPCTGCYTGEPHACPNAVRAPLTREVSNADLRDRLQRLEGQYDALAREHAYLRASIPDLDDLRRVKDLVSVPDFYVPLETTWIQPGATPSLCVQSHSNALVRALVVSVGSDDIAVVGFFIGQRSFGMLIGTGIQLSAFQALLAEQKTFHVRVGLTITLQLQNKTSHDIVFSGAFVLKESQAMDGE